MLSIIQDLGKILSYKQKIHLIFIFLSAFIMSALDMIGVGSLVGFIAVISTPEVVIELIPIEALKFFLLDLDQKTLVIYSAILIISVFLIKNLIFLILYYVEAKIKKNLNVDFSKRIFATFLKRPYIFHTLTSPVSSINTILPVTNRAIQYIFSSLTFFREGLTIFFLMGTLIFIDIKTYSIVFILFLIISFLFNFFSKKKANYYGGKTNFSEEKALGYLNKAFSYIKLIKLFNTNDFWVKKFFNEKNRLHEYQTISYLLSRIPKIILEIAGVSIVVFIFIFFIVVDNKNIEEIIPFLTLIVLIVVRCLPAFTNLNQSLNSINYTNKSINRILEILTDKTFDQDDPKYISKKKILQLEKIEVKNLSFSYNEDYKILEDVSFDIFKGQIIGINGTTGSGKSTLVDLILGLLKPNKGQILLNGEELNKKSYENINIGYVPQDTYISDDTIEENIGFNINKQDIDPTKIKEAIKSSNLDNFINNLPEKVNTYIGEDGIRISGGQKQRIGLARALYDDPKLLILDEATSALDNETEASIINEITKLKKDKIIIMIAHRLNTLKNCDKIITVKDKKIYLDIKK